MDSVGFAVTHQIPTAIATVPARAWTAAIDADGGIRDGGDVVEVTNLLDTRCPPLTVGRLSPSGRTSPSPG
jgi:hypothetical protein